MSYAWHGQLGALSESQRLLGVAYHGGLLAATSPEVS